MRHVRPGSNVGRHGQLRIVIREEIADGNSECPGDRRKARSANAVRALLVFLHLLERYAHRCAEIVLREAEFLASVADLKADVHIDLFRPLGRATD
jgi:hypothetical protein